MSSAAALASVDDVVPYLLEPPPDFSLIAEPSTLPQAVPNTVPDAGVPQDVTHHTGLTDHIDTGIGQHLGQHLGDAVHHATGHAVDAAMDQIHDMVMPALIGMSALGGALLVGRATMAGAQALAAAAIRAAKDQAELKQRQLDACRAAACWKDAAFAAARANARADALRARIRRAGPDGPPGPPDVPPPLDLTGMSLEQMWRRLADTDRRLRCAEAAYARATMVAAGGPVSVPHTHDTGADDDWHTKLRARRHQALEEYERAATETDSRDAAPQRQPATAAAGALTEDEVLRRGADLLATLPRNVSAAHFRFIEEKITSAAEIVARRPSAAKLHLREAARFAEQRTREAEQLQETEEWAAQQLAFLRDVPPDVPGPLPDATAEIAVLEGILDKGSTPTKTERLRVEARVGERVDAYQRAYAAEVIRAAVERSEPETVTHSRSGAAQVIDWTPPGWDDGHWLRVSVDAHGSARVATMHRERGPDEETDADRDLDRRRCAQASEHLEALRQLTKRAGLSLTFDLGAPPEQPARREKPQPVRAYRPAPKARSRDDQERRR
ncbi:hypothetical protein [Streptomyces sp. ME19-01-6]|uniref:hypothetical protein n=1 Tax=Streptomyces sp. ME19-01-6 TaxID=3028686 RepID=UPI0029A51BEC|nr:hypothetical protein [Streptomyces sp. ME19-01-6]MDX3228447.1 hypothetical protein [Streptomyces sp. ME19-01-6]